MRRPLYCHCLLGSLLLVATACTRNNDPGPATAPTLAGTWKLDSTETTELASNGSVQSQTGPVPYGRPTTYVFTAATLDIKSIFVSAYTYTRAGNTLTLTPDASAPLNLPFNQDIMSLTATNLDLLDKRTSATTPNGTTLTTLHLLRQ